MASTEGGVSAGGSGGAGKAVQASPSRFSPITRQFEEEGAQKVEAAPAVGGNATIEPNSPTGPEGARRIVTGIQNAGGDSQRAMENLAAGRMVPGEARDSDSPTRTDGTRGSPTAEDLAKKRDETRVAPSGGVGKTEEAVNPASNDSDDTLYQRAYDRVVEEMRVNGEEWSREEIAQKAGERFREEREAREKKDPNAKGKGKEDETQILLKRLDSLSEEQRNQLMGRLNSNLKTRIEQQLTQENVSQELAELIRFQSELLAKYAELLGEKDEKKKKSSVRELIAAMIVFLGKEAWKIIDPLEGLEG